jgi:hypothetical protein
MTRLLSKIDPRMVYLLLTLGALAAAAGAPISPMGFSMP